ncbi:MAG: transcriptional repressor [Alphaproteobacteria bacterium]|nr:transcriptional repressor [Alphaproteobacteria bacterium]MBU1549596.1 transcriptional repressor [Alphaproteobacteria bacterium]MBU2336451.1 transcriptional repressor [Alphaproteobacteria bacterium]MBU2387668.1 transcriptional repressor [Alphaproteobacteria bacterium]
MQHAADADDLKLTKNQSLVLSVLQSTDQPLSAYTILARLRDDGIKAPLQVYRALEKLLETGRIHRLESMNAFVVCCHSRYGQMQPRITAFEICEGCGKVNEFHDSKIEDALSGMRAAVASRSAPPPSKSTASVANAIKHLIVRHGQHFRFQQYGCICCTLRDDLHAA